MAAAPHSRRALLRRLLLAGLGGAAPAAAVAPRASAAGLQLQPTAAYSHVRSGFNLLVLQHGKVVHESYANGAKRGEPRRIYSGTKGFWGLAALAAAEEGIIRMDEPVADTIGEWRTDPAKARIRVAQLLDFTSGLERCVRLHGDGLKDRNALALAHPLVAGPGRSFIYGPAALQVFHELLKRKLVAGNRRETPARFLERRVLSPLGLRSQRYLPDQSGNPLLAAGFVMTAAQWLKMGQCLLREGQPVVRPDSFARIRDGSTANAVYNLGFWNNRAAGRPGAREVDVEHMLDLDWHKQNWTRACICRHAPSDLLACIGSRGQRLFAIPSLGLVIVRQGERARFNDAEFLRILLGGR